MQNRKLKKVNCLSSILFPYFKSYILIFVKNSLIIKKNLVHLIVIANNYELL